MIGREPSQQKRGARRAREKAKANFGSPKGRVNSRGDYKKGIGTRRRHESSVRSCSRSCNCSGATRAHGRSRVRGVGSGFFLSRRAAPARVPARSGVGRAGVPSCRVRWVGLRTGGSCPSVRRLCARDADQQTPPHRSRGCPPSFWCRCAGCGYTCPPCCTIIHRVDRKPAKKEDNLTLLLARMGGVRGSRMVLRRWCGDRLVSVRGRPGGGHSLDFRHLGARIHVLLCHREVAWLWCSWCG